MKGMCRYVLCYNTINLNLRRVALTVSEAIVEATTLTMSLPQLYEHNPAQYLRTFK